MYLYHNKHKMFGGGRQRVRHKEGDVLWLHKSKGDLLEARGLSRTNLKKFPSDVVEVGVYGERYYLDLQEATNFIIKHSEGTN